MSGFGYALPTIKCWTTFPALYTYCPGVFGVYVAVPNVLHAVDRKVLEILQFLHAVIPSQRNLSLRTWYRIIVHSLRLLSTTVNGHDFLLVGTWSSFTLIPELYSIQGSSTSRSCEPYFRRTSKPSPIPYTTENTYPFYELRLNPFYDLLASLSRPLLSRNVPVHASP